MKNRKASSEEGQEGQEEGQEEARWRSGKQRKRHKPRARNNGQRSGETSFYLAFAHSYDIYLVEFGPVEKSPDQCHEKVVCKPFFPLDEDRKLPKEFQEVNGSDTKDKVCSTHWSKLGKELGR